MLYVAAGCIPASAQTNDIPDLDAAQRLQRYLHRTYSWQRLSWLASDTAVDHLLGDPEWGRGAGGYGRHYASSFGRRIISNSVEFGVGLTLHEDIGFHASRRKGFLPRIGYATQHAFLVSGPGGRIEPAYARFAGIAGGALIAPAWHRRTLSASGFFGDMAFSSLDQVQNSLLTEFTPELEKFGRSVRRRLWGK